MKKIISLILSFVLISSANAFAVSIDDINSVISDTEKYLYDNSQTPTVSSIGGEWLITGLSRNRVIYRTAIMKSITTMLSIM